MTCPTHDRVLDYVARRLTVTDRDAVEDHVDMCAVCRELLGELARAPELVSAFAADPAIDSSTLISIAGPEDKRYERGGVLGRGGMGEVRLARDLRVQREVAVKHMHAGQNLERFVHEARLQGGLEHPSIVPVHDVGIDADGVPYFVMKRLVGTTLEALFASHVGADGIAARRQFLGKLVDVCLAVEFAHTRGIVHRDLKPANIMLGDFGEVYVLDWGVARLVRDPDDVVADDAVGGDLPPLTRKGAVVGTPGYMAPEQARAEVVDARADVFALGCILFEILTGQPARSPTAAASVPTMPAVPSTLSAGFRPSDRARDVPADLDDLCAAATSRESATRPSARELATGIQAHLDRSHDLTRRRALGEQHADAAEQALAIATDAARATAMREASRALAVDPDSARAQALLARLLLDAPTQPPAAALAAADAERARGRQRLLGRAAWGYVALGCLILLLFVEPTHNAIAILVLAAMPLTMGIMVVLVSRRVVPLRSRWYFLLLACNTIGLGVGSIVFGPLLIMPFAVVGSMACWLSLPTGYAPSITVFAHFLAIVPMVLLELAGVLPSTFAIIGHSIVLTPVAFDITPISITVLSSIAFVAECATTIFFITHTRRVHDLAQDRVHTHTWHLEQLLPKRVD